MDQKSSAPFSSLLNIAADGIFSRVQDAVIILDLSCGISGMNRAALDFFGMKSREDASSAGLERLFGEGYRFGEHYTDREIAPAFGGKVKTGILSQSDLKDQGRLVGKLVIIHDTTRVREEEHKRAGLEYSVLQAHASRLESLGLLAGGIAHDFNNMLSGIIGYATILRFDKDGLSEKQLSHAESIIRIGRQAADLTKKLTAFARRNVSETVVFNLHETVTDTVSLLAHSLGKKVLIATDLDAYLPYVKGDRAQIQNMLFTMAINARDAMPDGGEVRFTIRNETLDDAAVKVLNDEARGGVFLVVDVRDTGCGMADEVKKKIFDPFFTTKQPGKGTGLGLSSAYGIARSHKGFITVDSAVGAGTVFHVFLPANTDAAPVAETKNIPDKAAGMRTILLVDDDINVRATTARMLQSLGYAAVTCMSGEEAVAWYREHHTGADLVLLDVMMPGMSGDQCAAALQRINPKVRIVFVSGFPDRVSPEMLGALSQSGGLVKMVQKPLTIENLSATVADILGAPSSGSD